MKRNLILTAMAVAVAGAGSVAAFSMESPGVASQQVASNQQVASKPASAPQTEAAVPAPVAARPVVVAAPVAAPAPTAAVHKASLEVHQAPVPLLMKARPPVDLDAAQDATEAQADAEKTDGFDQKAAQAFIEADGYRGVQVLDKSPSGSWRAKALRGKTVVMLTVDASGSVSAD